MFMIGRIRILLTRETTTFIVVNQRRDQSQDFRIAAIELDAMPAKE
jgi:hypothetical protein